MKEFKKISKASVIIFIFLALCCFGCTKKTRHNELILGTNASYPPYESVNAQGDLEGFDIDVAQAIAKKLNKKLVIKDMSFDALILGLNQEKFDMIMGGISITPSREKEIIMVPYQGEVMKAFVLVFWGSVPVQIKSISDVKDYQNKTIAVQTGTIMEEYMRKFPDVISKTLESSAELIMDIKHQKSAAVLLEPHIARDIARKHGNLGQLEIPLPPAEWVKGNGIGIRKNNLKLLQQIQNAIDALKREGVIQDLEKKWLKGKGA